MELKHWEIFANFPNCEQTHRLDGGYVSQTEAEAEAEKYRKRLGFKVGVHVRPKNIESKIN